MATNQPQNLLEWRLHCVLKRANLLQYYDGFIRQGECDVLQLSEADDLKFKDVMQKVGMAKKSIHVRLFKNTLLEWVKDPEKDSHVPSYLKEDDDSRMPPAPRSLNPRTATPPLPDKSSVVQQLPKSTQGNQTKEKDELTSVKLEKKEFPKQQDTTQQQKHSEVKGKNSHVTSYIKEDDDSRMPPAPRSLNHRTATPPLPDKSSVVPQLPKSTQGNQTKEKDELTSSKSEKKEFPKQQDKTQHQTHSEVKDQKYHGLARYYDELLDNTVLDKMVLDNLISRCILMIEDREEIIKPTTQRERNKVLLDILTERPYPTFHLFKDVLQESEPSNSCVQELVKRMTSTESRDEHISCQAHEIILNKHKVKLQKNYTMFVHGVDSRTDIADHLYQSDVLSTEEKEEICHSSLTQQESNRLLYNKLIRKGGDAYKHLLEAVIHGKYHDVASEMEKTELSDQDIQLCQIGMEKLKDRHEKKDIRMNHDEVIPKHILEQFEKRLEQWKKDDQQFVSTEAEKHVMQNVLTQSSVTLVGNSGTGKSFLSKHIALIMKKQGYTVIPCSKPEDIGKWFKHGRKTLFVFDDVCGRYTLNQQIYTDWKQRLDHIISLLEDKCCKIISTCRLEVYKDEVFSNLSFFKMCNIDLSSQEFKLSAAEKNALAEVYFKENTDEVKEWSDKYVFFPLLCSLYHKQNLQKNVSIRSFFSNPFDVFKDQVVQMYGESDAGKMQYCSLVLCVMFNNTLTEENLSLKDKKIGAVLEDLLEECELNKGTSIKRLKKSLETLEGTYVVKEDNKYKIIHDKLFDFLAKYFGEKMLQIFIDHANTDFIEERFLWKITDNMGIEIEFVIRIPDKYINRYIERLLKDWENGYVNSVCQNRNMKSTTFTEIFITRLNQLDLSKQQELVSTKDIHNKDIAFSGSCYLGTVDLVKWLISRNTNINYCREDGWFPLLWTSQEGHVDVVKVLLQHSADVNKCKNNGVSSLYIASQEGHVDVVKVLLQHSADVNKCNNNGVSPLYTASYNGHVNVVKVLLQHSADVNKCNNDGVSPLYVASENGHVDVVKVLLQHSADVNKCNNNGVSPLYIASEKGHVNVVKVLLQHSADVNKCDNDDVSPLYVASQNGHVDVVKVLLQHSADVNKCKNNGVSPLYIASQEGHVDVVKVLLQHSADVNKCNNNGVSPLYIASYNGHVNVVKVLLQHSADVNKCDNNGVSPLSIASQVGHVNVVIELLQHSADVNKCNNNGVSPLSIASEKGHVNVVKVLLQHSADVNKCDNDGVSPLSIASQNGHVDVVKELLQHSADVNKCDNNGASPLYIASYNGHVNVVKVLLQHSADVNKCDNDDVSPLYIASQNGHVNVVKVLLQHSADVNKCKNNGVSPLSIASHNGHVNVVKELLQHSADVNKCSNDGHPPLQMACYNNKIEVVHVLLQCDDVDINLCDDDGCSSLYWASQKGHVDVVTELLQHSADVNKCNNKGKNSLNVAQEQGHIEIEQLLKGKGIDQHLCQNDQ
ncbi:uncharacterized protein LOC127712406 isoform X3 [Mytilus californianus]|uniref:uncharacterized protein LOC127712406 isoform X3 n=1 Tax=Mytilus californianus TaxID=6549 RepID=UPI002245443D|nr:uncharacterized protein LOC127712406 isoform X3 [Mytilus californianus]